MVECLDILMMLKQMVHPIIIQNINDLVSIALKSCNCYRLLDEARCIVDDLIEE